MARTTSLIFAALFAVGALATPLEPRAAATNTVLLTDTNTYCMIMPKNKHTTIGDSETSGGTKTYCSAAGKFDSSQGTLPDNFWKSKTFKSGKSKSGGRFAQITGCIRPSTLDRLVTSDGGGQYDSSGGSGKKGNPVGSVCRGYKHYVELVEPDANRACIKCCDNSSDCPLNKDTAGCPAVIPGTYSGCN